MLLKPLNGIVKRGLLITFVAVIIKQIKYISRKAVALFLVAVFAMLAFNQSAYIHSHKLVDGSVVSHAHPYNKTSDSEPIKSHHHTLADFLTLENLSLLFLTIILVISLQPLARTLASRIRTSQHQDAMLAWCTAGRAPPAI